MTLGSSRGGFPILHLTSQVFARGSHPGIHRTVRGLAGRGPQVVLCTARSGYVDEDLSHSERATLAARQIHVHPIEMAPLRKAFPPRGLLAAIRGAYGKPGAIIAHMGKNAFRALPLGALADVPIVAIFHGEDANLELRDPRYRDRFARWFGSPGAVALGVSDNLTQKILDAGFPADRAHTHHLGIDAPLDAPSPIRSGGALRLILSGRLMAVKGTATALRALALARRVQPEIELHLFGSGPEESRLRALADDLGLATAVHFHGTVSVGELRAAMAAADLLIQPSEVDDEGREEGVPNSVLEGMFAGLPVVATRHGGIPEAVEDGVTGRLVPERSPDALSAAIVELADASLRQRLGAAGRAKVEAEYDNGARAAALAEHVATAREAHRRIPRRARQAAWNAALAGYAELPEAVGRRERLRWPGRLLARRMRPELP